MTTFVDPQHVDVVIAAAQEEVRFGCYCDRLPSGEDQCFPHLVLALLRPSVTAFEPVL